MNGRQNVEQLHRYAVTNAVNLVNKELAERRHQARAFHMATVRHLALLGELRRPIHPFKNVVIIGAEVLKLQVFELFCHSRLKVLYVGPKF